MPPKPYAESGWFWKRFENLPNTPLMSGDIQRALNVSSQTLWRWTQEPLFKSAGVAIQNDAGKWVWNKDKLRLWLIHIGALKNSRYRSKLPAKNPPAPRVRELPPVYPEPDEALKELEKLADENQSPGASRSP